LATYTEIFDSYIDQTKGKKGKALPGRLKSRKYFQTVNHQAPVKKTWPSWASLLGSRFFNTSTEPVVVNKPHKRTIEHPGLDIRLEPSDVGFPIIEIMLITILSPIAVVFFLWAA
jgi:hypothetical protein